jgi:hypothetical protein
MRITKAGLEFDPPPPLGTIASVTAEGIHFLGWHVVIKVSEDQIVFSLPNGAVSSG